MKTDQVQESKTGRASAETLKEGFGTDAAPSVSAVLQRRRNDTGLPDNLKAGIENLSGYSMDDVKVHYNSSQPATLQAHAYAQGTNIHVAPGQERHLPHEAWHVVQQKQGRVKPTGQLKGKVPVNDDAGLEKEADVMGSRALQGTQVPFAATLQKKSTGHGVTAQAVAQLRQVGLFGLEAEVVGSPFTISSIEGFDDFALLSNPEVVLEEYGLGKVLASIEISLDNERVEKIGEDMVERKYTVEFIQDPIDVLGDPLDAEIMEMAWSSVVDLWKALAKNKEGKKENIEKVMGDNLVSVNDSWEGEQFSDYEGNPQVTKDETGETDRFRFDWKKSLATIDVASEDPQVSPQLTAGASLIAAEKVFLATYYPLAKQEAFTKEKAAAWKAVPDTEDGLATAEANALAGLIKRYLGATRPRPAKTKRYMKEYIPLMVRNSLDAVYQGMSTKGRSKFLRLAFNYLKREENNALLTFFGIQPDAPVFAYTSSKEDDAQQITVEHLLFSILRIKKGEEDKLVKDTEATPGDAFSKKGMAGLGEINGGNPEILKKYGIDSPDEMMRGVKGVILENRLGKLILMSEMPTLFVEAVTALRLVEELMTKKEDELI